MTLATVPRYEPDRSTDWGDRAVVIGASMAGLVTGRVLADGFDEVTVLDRDPLPDEPVARRGVPQAGHVHILLTAGQSTLEDLLPGYGEDLIEAGGLVIDGARDTEMYAQGERLADGRQRIPLYCATRSLYEALVRHRVAALDGVTLRPECRFTDYVLDEATGTVEGVEIENASSEPETVAADLVVDATGRTSRTPTWLADHGYASPPLEEVHIDLGYSTAFVDRPPDDRRAFVVMPSPGRTTGAGGLPVEGDRWLLTLFGLHGVHPPTDPAGFVDFAADVPAPEPERLLEEHPLASEDISGYPFPSNRRYRYEALDRFPEGLVVVGDAIASFNPIYAQGMSVAALEALHLYYALAAGGLDDLGPRFFDRTTGTIDVAWNMAVGADHQFPRTEGPKPRGTDLTNRYLSRLIRHAHHDAVLADAFRRVQTMERPPSSLLHPRIAWRVLKPSLSSPDSSPGARSGSGRPQ